MRHGDTSEKTTADSARPQAITLFQITRPRPSIVRVPVMSKDKTVKNKDIKRHKLTAPAVSEPSIILKVNPESFLTQLNIFCFFYNYLINVYTHAQTHAHKHMDAHLPMSQHAHGFIDFPHFHYVVPGTELGSLGLAASIYNH